MSSLLKNSHPLRIIAGLMMFFGICLFASCGLITSASVDRSDSDRKNIAALEIAESNIDKFRKNDVKIKLFDKSGKPIKNANINIKQVSHDFKFGCYLKIDDLAPEKLPEYERNFSQLFNYAVIGTYWDFVGNTENTQNWSWFEKETELARKLKLRMQAAPVIWGTNPAGIPKWLPRDKERLQLELNNWIGEVSRRSTDFEDLEIVNEPLAPKSDLFAEVIGNDYVETAFRKARETSPEKTLMINESGVFGAMKTNNYNRDAYFDLLSALISKNVPLDVIGIQAHAIGEWFQPANVAEQLNRYATLGKPIQITEFSSQLTNYRDRKQPLNIAGNYQTGIWDQQKQAEFYREFYTIAFGNPQVEAIVTWGLDDERAWLPGIGLIDKSGAAKPNYRMLDQLINKDWKTTVEGITETDGTYGFRGFYGKYEVTVVVDGKITVKEFKLEKGKSQDWLFVV